MNARLFCLSALLLFVILLFAQTQNPALDINRANIWHFGVESVSLANDAPRTFKRVA